MSVPTIPLSHRELALLRAVRAGRVDMTRSSEPDMFVDGLNCCDQAIAHTLFHRGWVRPAWTALGGAQVPAELTAAGLAALGLSAAGIAA